MKESLEDILKEARKSETEFRFNRLLKKISRIIGILFLSNLVGMLIINMAHTPNDWIFFPVWLGAIFFFAFVSAILASIFAIIPHHERDYSQQFVVIFLIVGLVFLGLNTIISIFLIGDLIVS